MRVGYLGPQGTFTHEAALAGAGAEAGVELVPLATIYDAVMAVAGGQVDRSVVPIENSIEGSVTSTLDTLAINAVSVHILAEYVHQIEQCLIAATPLALSQIEVVVSHPQASAQCAHYLHEHLPQARVMTTSSTADAVRMVAEHEPGWAALGPRLAAERYGCVLLAQGVEDREGNETRFVWLGREPLDLSVAAPAERWKTSILFWGAGTDEAGWLVRCLAELSDRGVNMTRIESRPLKRGLGQYMFFVDCEGRRDERLVAGALDGLARHASTLRVLGSYPAA
jgi:prephenate dehydratase